MWVPCQHCLNLSHLFVRAPLLQRKTKRTTAGNQEEDHHSLLEWIGQTRFTCWFPTKTVLPKHFFGGGPVLRVATRPPPPPRWYGGGSKNRYQNGTLVSGNMDQNLRNPFCLILSHIRMGPPGPPPARDPEPPDPGTYGPTPTPTP